MRLGNISAITTHNKSVTSHHKLHTLISTTHTVKHLHTSYLYMSCHRHGNQSCHALHDSALATTAGVATAEAVSPVGFSSPRRYGCMWRAVKSGEEQCDLGMKPISVIMCRRPARANHLPHHDDGVPDTCYLTHTWCHHTHTTDGEGDKCWHHARM